MALDEIHQGDIGTIFRLTVKDSASIIDVGSPSVNTILFELPDGTTLAKTATFPSGGDGSDGKIEYKTIAGDLSLAGPWNVQAHVVLVADTEDFKTDLKPFTVFSNVV